MNTNNGGPAFPVSTGSTVDQESGVFGHQSGNATWQFPGMTLRDYFAAKAMQGMYANPTLSDLPHDRLAKAALDAANAMIAARGDV